MTKTFQVFVPKVKIPPMTLTKSYQVFIPKVKIIEEFLKYIWRALYIYEHLFLKRWGILCILFNNRMGVALLKGPQTYLYSLLIVGVRPSHSPFTSLCDLHIFRLMMKFAWGLMEGFQIGDEGGIIIGVWRKGRPQTKNIRPTSRFQ
jgi:hypothetical protein